MTEGRDDYRDGQSAEEQQAVRGYRVFARR
jgi:hypothetical protein